MKPLKISKIIICFALIAFATGAGYNYYEICVLPTQPTVDRTVAINMGKGPLRYGTSRENILNKIGNYTAFGALIIAIIATGIGKRFEKK